MEHDVKNCQDYRKKSECKVNPLKMLNSHMHAHTKIQNLAPSVCVSLFHWLVTIWEKKWAGKDSSQVADSS